MKWYEERFVNHRDWILDHLDILELDSMETVVVLMIDFMNQYQLTISNEELSRRTNLSEEDIENTISLLCAKNYLVIRASSSGITFSLNGLFETEMAKQASILDTSLIEIFQNEFGRTLNSLEMEKISEWSRNYDKKMIIYALREASAYQKLTTNYIDRILVEWKNRGLTVEKIEWELSH